MNGCLDNLLKADRHIVGLLLNQIWNLAKIEYLFDFCFIFKVGPDREVLLLVWAVGHGSQLKNQGTPRDAACAFGQLNLANALQDRGLAA